MSIEICVVLLTLCQPNKINMRLAIFMLLLAFVGCSKENKDPQEVIESKPLEISGNEIVNYMTYCNDRFDVCIIYPSNFNAQHEPANGDGRTFRNEIDSAEIVLYGFIDQTNQGLQPQLDLYKEFLEIDSQTKIENGYEILGQDLETGFKHKERIFIKPDTTAGTYADGTPMNIIYSLQFTYPVDKDKKYRKYWSKMIEKLK